MKNNQFFVGEYNIVIDKKENIFEYPPPHSRDFNHELGGVFH